MTMFRILCVCGLLGMTVASSSKEIASAPGPFEIVKSFPVSEPTWGGKWNDLYLVAAQRSILVYRITGEKSSDYQLVATLYPSHNADFENCAIDGGLLFAATRDCGLLAYDLRALEQVAPGKPAPEPAFQFAPDRSDLKVGIGWVAVKNGRVYAAHRGRGLSVLDRQTFKVLGQEFDDIRLRKFTVGDGGIIYATDGGRDLTIVDASDPKKMRLAGRIRNESYATEYHGVPLIDGDTLYVAEFNGGLGIYDISDPRTPVLKSRFREGGPLPTTGGRNAKRASATVQHFAGDGARFFVGARTDVDAAGLTATGIETLAEVSRSAQRGGTGLASPTGLFLSGDTLAIPTTMEGIRFYDVSDPANPKMDLLIDLPSRHEGMAKVGRMLYVTTDIDGVWQLDWDSAAMPIMSRRIPIHGLTVFDLADPAHPRQIATIEPDAPADWPHKHPPHIFVHDIQVFPERDLVAYGGHTVLALIDVKDPANPKVLSCVTTAKECSCATFSPDGRYLVAVEKGNSEVFDIQDPTNPIRLTEEPIKHGAEDALFHKGYLLISGRGGGVDVYKVGENPADVALVQNIPAYFFNSKFFVEGDQVFINCQGVHEVRLKSEN